MEIMGASVTFCEHPVTVLIQLCLTFQLPAYVVI